jgi:hypothetical protein
VFGNRVLRKIYGTKEKERARGWRKLHTEELHKYTIRQILLGLSSQEG